ncbi:MAG: hypothetical protein N2Z81_02130 [Hydrogenothermaceae bacterium]|nr:hypothetical protein [Hydrogenothermaceae bacterium]
MYNIPMIYRKFLRILFISLLVLVNFSYYYNEHYDRQDIIYEETVKDQYEIEDTEVILPLKHTCKEDIKIENRSEKLNLKLSILPSKILKPPSTINLIL